MQNSHLRTMTVMRFGRNIPRGRDQNSPLRATNCFKEMLVSCFCGFCGMSQKAITTFCEWCQITISGYIEINTDSSVRLLQKSQTMLLLSVRLCGNLQPQILNFDVSPNFRCFLFQIPYGRGGGHVAILRDSAITFYTVHTLYCLCFGRYNLYEAVTCRIPVLYIPSACKVEIKIFII